MWIWIRCFILGHEWRHLKTYDRIDGDGDKIGELLVTGCDRCKEIRQKKIG